MSDERGERLVVETGTEMVIGKPAVPLPEHVRLGFIEGLASMAGVTEAHLPQCYAKGVFDPPRSVLFIVFSPGGGVQEAMDRIGDLVARILPADQFIDIVPLEPGNPMLRAVRKAGCELKAEVGRRPWWRFW